MRIPLLYWDDAVLTPFYLINCMSCSTLSHQVPYSIMFLYESLYSVVLLSLVARVLFITFPLVRISYLAKQSSMFFRVFTHSKRIPMLLTFSLSGLCVCWCHLFWKHILLWHCHRSVYPESVLVVLHVPGTIPVMMPSSNVFPDRVPQDQPRVYNWGSCLKSRHKEHVLASLGITLVLKFRWSTTPLHSTNLLRLMICPSPFVSPIVLVPLNISYHVLFSMIISHQDTVHLSPHYLQLICR